MKAYNPWNAFMGWCIEAMWVKLIELSIVLILRVGIICSLNALSLKGCGRSQEDNEAMSDMIWPSVHMGL